MNAVIVLMLPLMVVLLFGLSWLAVADGIADRVSNDYRSMRKPDD